MNKSKIKNSMLALLFASSSYLGLAQSEQFNHVESTQPIGKLHVDGQYRFFGYHRDVADFYGDDTREIATTRADDEFFAPILNLRMGVRPTQNSNLLMEMYYLDDFNQTKDRGSYGLSRNGINLEGGMRTKYGYAKVWMGGAHRMRFTEFTLASESQNRLALFFRNPWAWVFAPGAQYGGYYSKGTFQREQFFGQRVVNGAGFDLEGMPGNWNLHFGFGKTPFSLQTVPDNLYAVQLERKIKLSEYSFNFVTTRGLNNATNGSYFGSQVLSTAFKTNKNEHLLSGEFAISRYYDEGDKLTDNLGHAAVLNIRPQRRKTGIPMAISLYSIGYNYENSNATVINTSVTSRQVSFNGENVSDGTRPKTNVMNPVHLWSNNRHGFKYYTNFSLQKLNVDLVYGLSAEAKKNPNSQLTYYHKVGGLSISRIRKFSGAFPVGAYQNLITYFRGSYEIANINDTTANGESATRKHFNILLANLKYDINIGKKHLYLFYLGEYQSVSSKLSPMVSFNDNAYLRSYFHEVDAYFNVNKRLSLVGYYGLERVRGNQQTDLGENGLGRNQILSSIGAGFDFHFTPNAVMYFRTNTIDFSDKNFELTNVKSIEGNVELKVIF